MASLDVDPEPNEQRRRVVVITGAAGKIGSLISERLAGRWQIRATDARPWTGGELLDVTDQARCRELFRDADSVVHLAANPNPAADWASLQGPNVLGAYTVAAAAREAGVRRLVLASSLHAVSAYAPARQRRAEDAARPANLYGASKSWAEALGSWVAASSPTSVVALRIGYFSRKPPAGEEATTSDLSAWLSGEDCVRLVRAAVEADLADFVVVNGISANRHRIAELGEPERRIGYAPEDDAWR